MASQAHSHSSSTASPVSKEKYDGDIEQNIVGHGVREEDPEVLYVSKYGRLGPIMARLFASGVEARGVERVPEDQRDPKNTWNK